MPTRRLTKLPLIVFAATFLLIAMPSLPYSPASVRAQSQNSDAGYILIRVNCLEIRALPADLLEDDVAELQLMVFLSVGNQGGTFTFFQDSPEVETRGVRVGERFCSGLNALGPWLAVSEAPAEVAVWFLAVDNDDLSQLLDTALDGTGNLLADAFKTVIDTSGAVSVFSRTNLLALALELVLGRAIEAWEMPDTIGQYQTVLLRQQDWNVDSYTAVSADGTIAIEYDVLLTEETPSPSTSGTLQPAVTSISALICLNLDDLSALGNVLQVLESPPGVLAGAQIAFAQNWSAPSGWIIHRNSQQVQSVAAGDVASVWSPDACRPLRGQAITESLCPIGVTHAQIDSWKLGFAEVATVQSLIDEFNEARQGDLGAYPTGTVIPAGVVVATNFDERDANAWRQYPVRPIVHSGSWGLFETLGEYTAPNAGACRYID